MKKFLLPVCLLAFVFADIIYVPFFSQRNPLWANDVMVGSIKIGQSGCIMTVFTMFAKKVNPSMDLTPKTVNTWLKSNGGYTSGGALVWSQAVKIDGSGGIQYIGASTLSTMANLKARLDGGEMIIAKSKRFGTGTEHWVAIKEYVSTGTTAFHFKYWDPYDTSATLRTCADNDWVLINSATQIRVLKK